MAPESDEWSILLILEASAEEITLGRKSHQLWIRRVLYVSGEERDLPANGLDDVLAVLRDTALPFCDITWVVPDSMRPDGHELFEERVQALIDDFRDHASTVRFTA